jgi:hypothetical protein
MTALPGQHLLSAQGSDPNHLGKAAQLRLIGRDVYSRTRLLRIAWAASAMSAVATTPRL